MKRFSAQTAQARVLYLSCLSSVVLLVVFFSYSLLPHLHLRDLQLADSRSKTASDFQAPFIPEGLGDRPDGLFTRPGKSKQNGKGQPTYAILLPTYVRFFAWNTLVSWC